MNDELNFEICSNIIDGNPIVVNYLMRKLQSCLYVSNLGKNGRMLSNQEMMDQIDFIFKHNPQITLIFTDNKKGFRALRYRGAFQGREDIDLENNFTRSASAGF